TVHGAVGVGDAAEWLRFRERLEGVPRLLLGVREEAEDGGEVRARGPRQAKAVLLRAGVGALVVADAAGAVVLDAHAAEEAVTGSRPAVGARVVLGERPDRRLALAHQHALLAPRLERGLGVQIRVAAVGPGQVDLHHVERALLRERGALGLVDHVVGRRRDGVQRADHARLVAQGPEWFDLRHGRSHRIAT